MANLKPRKYRPLLRWHGGKWRIAPWIVDHFPRHHLYTEVFGGAASVLLRKPRVGPEIYNDLDGTLVQLFRLLQDKDAAEELIRRLQLTLYSREEFREAYKATSDPIEVARRTIIRSYMGYGSDGTTGRYSTGFRANVTSHLKLPAQEWAAYPEALRIICERVKPVTVEQCDARDILRIYDAPSTLHYVDPPYLPETRSQGNRRRGKGFHLYEHELETEDHVGLLDLLKSLEGMVILSGYPSSLYDETLVGWERVEKKAFADGGRERMEVLWINPAASEARRNGKRPVRKRLAHPGPLFSDEDGEYGIDGEPGDGDVRGRGGAPDDGIEPIDQAA